MNLPIKLRNFIRWRYSHIVGFFTAGAGLELFMNLFYIGEANIYRSIKKNTSDYKAEKQFEAEKFIFETVEEGRNA